MTRLNLVLLAVLIASSLYLVKVSYESRRLFTRLDRAQALALKLDTEHERLQIDRRAQATPLRVEKVAREKLQMERATPAVTEYVELPAGAGTQGTGAEAQAAGAEPAAPPAPAGAGQEPAR